MKKINKELLYNTTILYVEDEKMIRDEIVFFFKNRVKNFYTAKDGKEGLALYNKVNPDVVITDIQMPNMNGLEMVEAMGEFHAPIIITTAYSDVKFFLKAIKLKIDKFVLKPMDLLELVYEIQDSMIHKNLKNRLFEKERLLTIIDENILLYIIDEKGMIIDVSHSFCDFSEYGKDELIGSTYKLFSHEDTEDSLYIEMWKTITLGKVYTTEIKNRKKSGEEFWVKLTITPVFEDEEIVNYTIINQNITTKKKLEVLAIHDEMTGLYNRRHFNTVFEKEIRRCKRNNGILCLATLDIDNFKKYNDLYGHLSGDEALIKVAQVLNESTLRGKDYAFRIGGEEFAVILEGIEPPKALEHIKNIVEKIESLQVKHEENTCSPYLTVSAGIVIQDGDSIEDFTSLYNYSDEALYEAKDKGRNRVVLSSKSLSSSS